MGAAANSFQMYTKCPTAAGQKGGNNHENNNEKEQGDQ